MAESSRWQEVQTMFGRVTFKIIFKDWPINNRIVMSSNTFALRPLVEVVAC